jgi:glycosyltransferase involved in cell wall biosynthesis
MGPLLRAGEVDLVASHFALHTFPVLDLVGHRPLVIHFHGPWALESQAEGSGAIATYAKKQLEQITYRRANRLIVLSEAFRQILHHEYRVPLERIHVVPGGINVEEFKLDLSPTAARDQLGWPQTRPILLTVRRLVQRMGLENLITAMGQVRHHYPDLLLLIVGKGPLTAALQAQIEQSGLTEQIRLLGYVSDQKLKVAYRAANFSVLPTIALEGFGLTVIESLAAGTPVLGTPVGGIPEILRPFCKDLLFEGHTPEQLTQGLLEVLSGKRQLPSSTDCQAYVERHYNWQDIAQQIKGVYQAALGDPTP